MQKNSIVKFTDLNFRSSYIAAGIRVFIQSHMNGNQGYVNIPVVRYKNY